MRLRLRNQHIADRKVRWLPLQIIIEQACIPVSWECRWNPRDRVPEIPHRNTNTALLIHARPHTLGIHRRLQCLLGGVVREIDTHIELGECGLESELSEEIQSGADVGVSGCAADGEMGLQTDTVDRDAALDVVLCEFLEGEGLVVYALDAVVVVVKSGPWADVLACKFEGKLNVFGANGVQPYVTAQRAVIVERLVHNVPCVALVVEVACLVLDVVLKDADQLRLGVVLAGKPVGELVVPHEVVAAAHLLCLEGRLDDLLCHGVVEDIALWLDVHPFLAIGGCHFRSQLDRNVHFVPGVFYLDRTRSCFVRWRRMQYC